MIKPKLLTERNAKDAGAVADPTPMERFRELARKLVSVPRSELEEETRRASKRTRHGGEKSG